MDVEPATFKVVRNISLRFLLRLATAKQHYNQTIVIVLDRRLEPPTMSDHLFVRSLPPSSEPAQTNSCQPEESLELLKMFIELAEEDRTALLAFARQLRRNAQVIIRPYRY